METNIEIFLTKIDNSIERKIQREPLRQQTLWTQYARKIYKYVNSVNDDIKGYIIAALGIEIIERMSKLKDGFNKKDYRDIQIKYEMIVMYSLIDSIKNEKVSYYGKIAEDTPFLGKDNGLRIYNNCPTPQNPIINRDSKKENRKENENERQILVRQEGLGYIARYRNNVQDKKKEILEMSLGEDKEIIINLFIKELQATEIKFQNVNLFLREKIIEKLEMKNIIAQKKDWLVLLEINKKNNLQGNIYVKIEEDIILEDKGDIPKGIRGIFNELIEEKCIGFETLIQIKCLENFLTKLNDVFYQLVGKDINSEKEKLKVKELIEVYKILEKNKYCTDVKVSLKRKYPGIIEEIEYIKNKKEYDYKTIISTIINEHVRLQKADKKKPWIEIIDNEIIKNHIVEIENENNNWYHNYYIDAVKRLIRSMSE